MKAEQQPQLNDHNKREYPPMHTAEHILNQTMVRMFGCGRAVEAHIERKKSKCDYILVQEPADIQIKEVEKKVNEIISMHLPVNIEHIEREKAASLFDLNRLPENASEMLRIVNIGDYDKCPCIGAHVKNTGEIGHFTIVSYDYSKERLRLRFKIIEK